MMKNNTKFAFSTLGCPELNLDQACQLAVQYGFSGIEIRALEGRIDLPAYFEEKGFSASEIASNWKKRGLDVFLIDSSARLFGVNPQNWEELWRLARWADDLEIPYIRIYDGGEDEAIPNKDCVKGLLEKVKLWQTEKAKNGWRCDVLVETHWMLIHPENILEFVRQTQGTVGVLWDTFHTWRKSNLSPSEVWGMIGEFVRHIHIKDAVKSSSSPKGAELATFGKGHFPFENLFSCISSSGYDGQICLEWEKYWQPELDPLEDNLKSLQTAWMS